MAKHYYATLHIVHLIDMSIGDEDFYAPSANLDKEMMASAERMLEKKFSKRLHKLSKHKMVVLMGTMYIKSISGTYFSFSVSPASR